MAAFNSLPTQSALTVTTPAGSDPTRFIFPAGLLVAGLISLFLPAVSQTGNAYNWQLWREFWWQDRPSYIVRDLVQAAGLGTALWVMIVLSPRTGMPVRVLGYLAAAVGVGVELIQLLAGDGRIIPFLPWHRYRWAYGYSPGFGTWLYWLALAGLLVLYTVRETRTRRVRRAVPGP